MILAFPGEDGLPKSLPLFGDLLTGKAVYLSMATCTHLNHITQGVQAKTPNGCEECLRTGQRWVQLRMCLECGHVGCCDSSIGKHATKHFHEVAHPIMQSFQPGEDWRWCYLDETYV